MSEQLYTGRDVTIIDWKEERFGSILDIRELDQENVRNSISNMSVNNDLETWFDRLKSGFRDTEYRDMLFLNQMLTSKEAKMARCEDKKFLKTIWGIDKMKMYTANDPLSTIYVKDVKQNANSKENIIQCYCWRYSTLLKPE